MKICHKDGTPKACANIFVEYKSARPMPKSG